MTLISAFIIYGFLMYGLANILIYGSIFNWFRNLLSKLGNGNYSLYKLFTCMMCLPTWLGFGFGFFMYYIGKEELLITNLVYDLNDYKYIAIFLTGIITSGIVYAINTFVEYFEK